MFACLLACLQSSLTQLLSGSTPVSAGEQADRVLEQRKRETAWLAVGATVEAMPGEGVYAGSWCEARTLSPSICRQSLF